MEEAVKRLILLTLMLAGCSGPNLHTVERECGANTRPFPETWPCVKVGTASLPGAEDLKRQYYATGDVVAERITAGKMTEAEGRLIMANVVAGAISATTARQGSSDGGYATYQRVGPSTVVRY